MNVMPIVSVVLFLVLAGAAFAVHRWLRREAEDSDGVYGINERGETRPSEDGDIVGEA